MVVQDLVLLPMLELIEVGIRVADFVSVTLVFQGHTVFRVH